MANEIIERNQEGIIAFANNYITANNRVLGRDYDLTKSMVALYNNLLTTKATNGGLAINECSEMSIKNAIAYCINNELSVGKSQGYFIPYGKELQFQPSYFGLVKMAKDLCGVNIVSNVIRDGEEADVTSRSDGVMIIQHKPSIKCLNNKIVAVYSIATHISSGRVVFTNLMSVEEAKKSWTKSQTGCKVGKEFEHEMLIRTSERRCAKHLINKSNDGMMITITDEDGVVTPIDEGYLATPIDVQYSIDADFVNEDIKKESSRFEPTKEHIVTAEDLKLDDIEEPTISVPENAIEVKYSEYKENQDKYKLVPNSYNQKTRTCMVEVMS